MADERPIVHIAAAINAVGNAQLAVEADIDPVLGFRQWGGKDSAGNVTTWLARNKPGQLYDLQLTGPGFTGSGDGFLRNNSTGVLSSAPISANDVPNHDDLNGIDAGTVLHISDIEKAELHSAVTVTPDNALTLAGQNVGLNVGTGLQVVGNVLQADVSSVSHSLLDNLGSDDHLQYIRTDAIRGFTAAVTGQSATLGSHLTTRDDVLQIVEENSAGFEGSVLSIITTLPGSPAVGDRYLDNTAAPVSESGSLIEWTAGTPDAWVATWDPSDPAAVGTKVYVIDENTDYRYTGVGPTTGWESIAAITAHNQLSGLGNDDHTQYSLVNGTRAFTGPVGGISAGGTPSNIAILQDVLDNTFTPVNRNWGSVGLGTSTSTTFTLSLFGFEGDIGYSSEGVYYSNHNGAVMIDLNISFENGAYSGSMTIALTCALGIPSMAIVRDSITHHCRIAGATLEVSRKLYTDTAGGTQWLYEVYMSGMANGTTTTITPKISQIGMNYGALRLYGGTVTGAALDTDVLDQKRGNNWEKNIVLAPENGTFSNGFGDTPVPAYLMSGSRGGEGYPSLWTQNIWIDRIEAGIQSSAPINTGDTTMTLAVYRNQSKSLVTPTMGNVLVAANEMLTYMAPQTVDTTFAKMEYDDSIWLEFGGTAPTTTIDLLMVKMIGWYIQ